MLGCRLEETDFLFPLPPLDRPGPSTLERLALELERLELAADRLVILDQREQAPDRVEPSAALATPDGALLVVDPALLAMRACRRPRRSRELELELRIVVRLSAPELDDVVGRSRQLPPVAKERELYT